MKAAEMEDPAAARRAIVEMLWSRIDFKAAVEEEAKSSATPNTPAGWRGH
jgi:ribosomal protein S12 methylthiotransferase accessory factor YcaO